MSETVEADLVIDARALLGEGPLWHPAEHLLYWVDIDAHQVHRFDPVQGSDQVFDMGQAVGAICIRQAGGFALAVQDGFAVAGPALGEMEIVALVEADDTGIRMNDGKCDRQGRFWAGTMSYDYVPGAGALYRLDPDHTVTTMLVSVTVSNGLGWSPDGATMYYVDSFAGGIDAFDFDPDEGTITNRRRLVALDEEPRRPAWGRPVPDGLTVDADGYVWVAVYGAGEVRRYDPRGRLEQVVELPVMGVTSCTFGGEDLGELFITTARPPAGAGLGAEPLAGGLFRGRPGPRGLPADTYAG
ncbi:MAG: SMP-30/gluconolactonase/LRE family protein [Acidimicrobiales bacterium]